MLFLFKVTFLTFFTYVISDPVNNVLKPDTIFVSMSLFYIMHLPLGLLPIIVVSIIEVDTTWYRPYSHAAMVLYRYHTNTHPSPTNELYKFTMYRICKSFQIWILEYYKCRNTLYWVFWLDISCMLHFCPSIPYQFFE